MKNKKNFFVAVLISWLGIGAGFKAEGSEMALFGRIVYIRSEKVQEYDLVSGKRKELYRHDGGLLYHPITEVNETTFIVGTLRGEMLLVGADRQAHVLGEGGPQVFFPAHGKLLYLDGTFLYEATLQDRRLQALGVVSEGPFTPNYPLLAISDDELLVRRRRGPYVKYDLRTGTLVDTSIEKCYAAAWRSRTREVICVDELSAPVKRRSGYALVGMDGRRRQVSGLLKLAVAAYVPPMDYVLAGRARWSGRWLAEIMDLVSYDFSTTAVRRIAKNVPVGLGRGAFWSPTRREN